MVVVETTISGDTVRFQTCITRTVAVKPSRLISPLTAVVFPNTTVSANRYAAAGGKEPAQRQAKLVTGSASNSRKTAGMTALSVMDDVAMVETSMARPAPGG